ncbi:hypothetical protein [uncultured Eudoraea sp.]|uniref:hypothetical protein n=1 Tax=uncultured Eudoraea sp. TaxID=1035614 RepID=UPI002619EBAC|nr:hypothetical protein [uncultured Eudoraea sp.]
MRLNFTYIVLAFLFLVVVIPEVNAQYGYNNRTNNRYSSTRSQIPRVGQYDREPENLTAEEIVERIMPKITEAIELNDFEQAVVTSILTKYVQQSIELQILELPANKTKEAGEKIRENQKEELKAGLPEDKFNQLMEFQKEGYNKMKKKKKKKNKNKIKKAEN